MHHRLLGVLTVTLVLFGMVAERAHADITALLLAHTAGSVVGERGAADGTGASARFNFPSAVALDGAGTFALVADAQNNTIRRFDLATGMVTTIAGAAGQRGTTDGAGAVARFAYPSGVAMSADGSFALVADTDNHTIRRIDLGSGQVRTLAGSAGLPGAADGSGTQARFFSPLTIALSPDASFALVADSDNHTIRRVEMATGMVVTIAGSAGQRGSADGAGSQARFGVPRGVAISPDARFALVADSDNHTIRRLDLATGTVVTMAGKAGASGSADGINAEARFAFPWGIAFEGKDAALVADFSNSTIRRIALGSGAVTTAFGRAGAAGGQDGIGTAARLNFPAGIASAGGVTLVADTYNHSLRRASVVVLQARAYLPLVSR